MGSSPGFFSRIKEYNTILKIDHIARRYFVLNAFDGVLTTLGILLATFLVGTTNPVIVISAVVGATVALSVSGIWGAYMTEAAERGKELKDLEKILYRRLRKTKLGRATRAATIITAIVNGIAPFTTSLTIIIPFFFAGSFPEIKTAYYISFGLAFVVLAIIGGFLGSISKDSIPKAAVKTAMAGIVCAAILFAIQKIF